MYYLKEQVLEANLELVRRGLVLYTWGNVSAIDRERGLIAIKPSGVNYDTLRAEDIVVVNMDGEAVEGWMKPSVDTRTHLEIYKAFPNIGAVVHTHSTYATAWAQAGLDLPCLGTTQADCFCGSIPCTDPMDAAAMMDNYERETGRAIVRRFEGLDPNVTPAVLVRSHGPFTWGKDAPEAVHNAVVLEEVAKMAYRTELINKEVLPAPSELQDKHYFRKHGKNAYYGQ